MQTKQIATMLATILFAAMAFGGDKEHQQIEIRVIADAGDGATHLSLDSDDLGFKLHDMQVGENRSITDKDGRPILITRTEGGFTFDVDGKTIEMPAHDGGMSGNHTMAMKAFGLESVMVISEKEIDEATQAVVRAALESAGHGSVHFAGGHGHGGPHGVHVVKKVVEVEVTE